MQHKTREGQVWVWNFHCPILILLSVMRESIESGVGDEQKTIVIPSSCLQCSAEMDRRREENLASEGFLWKVHLYLKYSGENGKCDIIVLPSISHGSLGNIEGINNLFPWQGWDSGSQLHQQSMKQGEAICWRGNNVGGRTDMGIGRRDENNLLAEGIGYFTACWTMGGQGTIRIWHL